jgi:hypothetical protein
MGERFAQGRHGGRSDGALDVDRCAGVHHTCPVSEQALTVDLLSLSPEAAAAFGTAAAERCLRNAAEDAADDGPAESRLIMLCFAVGTDLWSALTGDEHAFDRISRSVATFYLSPFWRRTYVDHSSMDWPEASSLPVQVTLHAALAYLHSSAQMAARAADMARQLAADPDEEASMQARDLSILREHGGSLVLNQLGANDSERVEALAVTGLLRTR